MSGNTVNEAETEGGSVTVALPRLGREFPKYVTRQISRHGREVYYFQQGKGAPKIRLWAEPGTPEFMAECLAAKAGKATRAKSFVYFALSGKRIKIGVSKDPKNRLGSLRTGSPTKVRIHYVTPGDQTKERELHRLFAEYRVNGEWFLYSRTIRDWIARDEAERSKPALEKA